MLLNIQELVDEAKCYAVVRELRWPEGVKCPHCRSGNINKRIDSAMNARTVSGSLTT